MTIRRWQDPKTILLLDVDEPLAAFDRHFHERCVAQGFTFDVGHYDQQAHRYFTEHIPDPKERKAARAMIDEPGWFRGLPVTEGAQEGVAALLADDRFDVWACTKPLETNPTCPAEKMAWLHEHFPALVGQVHITPDKSKIVGDVLLDDAPKLWWFGQAMWRPVIFRAPFNGGDNLYRAELPRWSWGDPVDLLLKSADRLGAR